MKEAMISWFMETLGGKVGKEAIVFLISMVPILELRGGLIAAGPALLDVPMWQAIPICIVGNIIPVPFILLLITPIFNWMKKTKLFRPMVEKLETKDMHWECDCSVERLEAALMTIGKQDLREIIDEDGQAELTCHFCEKKYLFDREHLERLYSMI